jgi:hypothetical protein
LPVIAVMNSVGVSGACTVAVALAVGVAVALAVAKLAVEPVVVAAPPQAARDRAKAPSCQNFLISVPGNLRMAPEWYVTLRAPCLGSSDSVDPAGVLR